MGQCHLRWGFVLARQRPLSSSPSIPVLIERRSVEGPMLGFSRRKVNKIFQAGTLVIRVHRRKQTRATERNPKRSGTFAARRRLLAEPAATINDGQTSEQKDQLSPRPLPYPIGLSSATLLCVNPLVGLVGLCRRGGRRITRILRALQRRSLGQQAFDT